MTDIDHDSPLIIPPPHDAMEPGEVFDVIQNIQDPEHPLTLEQLNVVNLDHVVVVDYNRSSDGGDGGDMDEKRAPFPYVDVRFA